MAITIFKMFIWSGICLDIQLVIMFIRLCTHVAVKVKHISGISSGSALFARITAIFKDINMS